MQWLTLLGQSWYCLGDPAQIEPLGFCECDSLIEHMRGNMANIGQNNRTEKR